MSEEHNNSKYGQGKSGPTSQRTVCSASWEAKPGCNVLLSWNKTIIDEHSSHGFGG